MRGYIYSSRIVKQVRYKRRHGSVPRAPNPMPMSRTATVYGTRVFCKSCRLKAPSPRETPKKISAISGEYPSACPEGGGAVGVVVEFVISDDRNDPTEHVLRRFLSGRKSVLSTGMDQVHEVYFNETKKDNLTLRLVPRQTATDRRCHYRLLNALTAFSISSHGSAYSWTDHPHL